MEKDFLKACELAIQKAAALGVRIRPITMESAHRCLSSKSSAMAFPN